MKIRIKGNTIRYRLIKSDVKQLQETGFVEEKTDFGTNLFYYQIKSQENINELKIDFVENKICLLIPKSDADVWYDTDRITYKNKFKELTLILEKDFVCLDHTDEDQSDNYPNPNKTC